MAKEVKFKITAQDKTQAALASATRGLGKLKSVASAAKIPALAGAAVLGGLAALAKQAITTADAVAKSADAIGISTDALQEYTYALDLAGISGSETEASFKKFTKTFGELKAGTGSAYTFLKLYDNELIKTFQNAKTADDGLELLFRVLARVEDHSQRAALAAAFFGRSGAKMTVAVKDGSAALEAQRQRARDLGLVLEEDLLRSAERANDQFTILAKTIGTNLNRALLQVAPELGNLAERLTDAIPTIIEWVDQFGQFIGLIEKSDTDKLAEINEDIQELEETLGGFFGKIRDFRIFGEGALTKQLEKLQAEKREIEAAIERAAYEGDIPAPRRGAGGSSISSSSSSGGSAPAVSKELLKETADYTRELIEEVEAQIEVESEWAAASERTNAKRREGRQAVRDYLDELRLNNEILALEAEGKTEQAELLREEIALRRQIGGELLPEERAELEELKKAQGQLNEKIDDAGEKWQGVANIGLGAVESLQDGWESFFRYMFYNLDELIAVFKKLNDSAEGTGGDSAGGGIFGTLLGAAFGAFGGGGGASYGAGSTGIASGGFDYIPAFADGGSFRVNGKGGVDNNLIQFRATRGEDVLITPPGKRRGDRGGGTSISNHYVIDARSADSEGLARLERTIRELNGSIEKRAIASVNDAASRGKMAGLKR